MSKIIGNTTVTPMPVPDWNQVDPVKADYIKNKPDFDGLSEKVGDTPVSEQISVAIDNINFPVDSVNGQTGDVILSAADVGATTQEYVDNEVAKKSRVQIIKGDIPENLSTLKIHKLTQDEYNDKFESGELDENVIYLTPEEEIDLSPYATVKQLEDKADSVHNHDDVYYTETEIDGMLAGKSDESHNHDDLYDEKGAADIAEQNAKDYADQAASTVKDDLLNGAGKAYDTLKELGDLIDENRDAIDALEIIASGKANEDHNHDNRYYTETEIDNIIEDHDHDSVYDSLGSANTALESAKRYADNKVSQKSQVQIIIWEDDD